LKSLIPNFHNFREAIERLVISLYQAILDLPVINNNIINNTKNSRYVKSKKRSHY